MPRLPSSEITRYLARLDAFLARPVRMVVIGGFAIALGWNARHSTSDIDVLEQLDPDLVSAIKAAGSDGAIPIQSVSISSQPEGFEDRLRRLELPELRYLSIVLPEAHDLAIMKMARGLTHDLEGVEEIHAEQPLDLGLLVARFLTALREGARDLAQAGPATRARADQGSTLSAGMSASCSGPGPRPGSTRSGAPRGMMIHAAR